MRSSTVFALAGCLLVGATWIDQGRREGRNPTVSAPKGGWEGGNVILGNPTDRSIGITLHPAQSGTATISFGRRGEPLSKSKAGIAVQANVPTQITLDSLEANRGYGYQVQIKTATTTLTSPTYSFQTQRKAGSEFSFLVQGDSHPERTPKMHDPKLYESTLLMAKDQSPDFLICLGDDFSVDTLRVRDAASVEQVYQRQVPFLGLVGCDAPIFLVNGNHEQAALANWDKSATCLGSLVQNARNRNYLQPAPDAFYSGNTRPLESIGLLRNYYAWTWGDALFAVIDPYWHSSVPVDNALGTGPGKSGGGKRNRDLWNVTLGSDQYAWLKKTLGESRARYKFVFAHHVLGTGRGGIEQAPYYEWGGHDRNGRDAFAEKRPGWDLPIHQLFVKTGVTAFFQGHDHIFCRQELDGVIYQSCPCPADPANETRNGDAYQSGDKVAGAGLVKVTVNPSKATVEFIRPKSAAVDADAPSKPDVLFSYAIAPRDKETAKK